MPVNNDDEELKQLNIGDWVIGEGDEDNEREDDVATLNVGINIEKLLFFIVEKDDVCGVILFRLLLLL